MTRPFRPSNGTHTDSFMSDFCHQCVHMIDDGRPPCGILGHVLGHDIDHPQYPAEWVQEDDGRNARCTAVKLPGDAEDPPVTPRCDKTKDLFG